MTARDIVIQTLDFAGPERVARSFEDADLTFACHSAATHATEWKRVDGRRWERRDEWNNLWGRIDETSKGEVVKGVLESTDQIDGYELPDFSQPKDYARAAAQFANGADKYRVGEVPGFTFNIARKLFKLEDYLVYLLTEAEALRRLHDKIDRAVGDMIANYAAAGADAIMFWEDWGTQTQTLINPVLWKEEFHPRTKKLCALAHARGLKVIMHSCGAIGAIIPGLIDAGIDCLQFDQPTLHGIETLASYQDMGKISFWCPVDIQKTLQSGDEELIRREARELLDRLWKGRGGFIAGFYTDNASIGLDPRWQEAACDEFDSRGRAVNY